MVFSSETTVLGHDLEIQLYIHRDLLCAMHRAHIREENSLTDFGFLGKTMAKTGRDRQLTQEKAQQRIVFLFPNEICNDCY